MEVMGKGSSQTPLTAASREVRLAGAKAVVSTAARDDWASGQAALGPLRRQIDRVLDYLDGAAFVWRDVPPGTPWLVDPQPGRIGLLAFDQAQTPPGYLSHIALHLMGLSNAPGAMAGQKQLAMKIDAVLSKVTALLRRVHDDALLLANRSEAALLEPSALWLLDDLYTNANSAFVGEADPVTGSVTDGIVWFHDALQLLASFQVSSVPGGHQH